MFVFFKKQKKDDHLEKVIAYINSVYVEPVVEGYPIKYSRRTVEESEENYDFEAVSLAMEQYFKTGEAKSLITELEKAKRKIQLSNFLKNGIVN